MANQPLPGYPQPFGSRLINVFQHSGPANYQQGNNSDVITAKSLGMSSLDSVQTSPSVDSNANNVALYTMRVQWPVAQASANATGANQVNLQWVFAANGNEVANNANLVGEYTRIMVHGAL